MITYRPILSIMLLVLLSTQAISQTVSCSDPFLPSDWTGIGPYEYTEDNQQGRVVSIWVDPISSDHIYIGTRASGVWETINGGSTWTNLTGFDLPATGTFALTARREVDNPNLIYANTQFWGSDRNVYGLGLIYSKNGGNTWQREMSYPALFEYSGTVKQFKRLDIEFSGTKLYMTNGKYLFQRQTSYGSDSWNSAPILNLDNFSTKPGHHIAEIDFSPTDTNHAIVSSAGASEYDLLYTANASSASPTWVSLPVPTIPTDTGTDRIDIYYTSTFVSEDTIASLIRWHVFNWDLGDFYFTKDTMCLVLYHRNADNPIIISSQKYDDAISSLIKWGIYHDLAFPTGITDTFFVAFDTEGLQRGVRPSSGPITGIRTSEKNPPAGATQTHTDIRNYVIRDRSIWLATDGGISKAVDFGDFSSTNSFNDSYWESINGYGLNNVEFLSIANSEFEPYSLVAMSPDGNSYVYKREITSPFDQKFNTGFGADGYRVRRTSYNPDSVIFTWNGNGTRDPSNFYTYGMSNVNFPHYLHAPSFPKADGAPDDKQTNFSLKPFHFDEDGNFWAGTTDVFTSDNIYSSSVSWIERSITNQYQPDVPDENHVTTYSSISAFQQFTKQGATDTLISYFALIEDESNTNDDTIKLVRAKYYTDPFTFDEIYMSTNITPLLDEYPGPIHLVDTSNITDLIIDEANPDRLWVSFGFFKDKSENRILDYVQHADHPAKGGRIYYSDDAGETWSDFSNGLPNYPVICMEYWQGSDDVIFAGTDVGVYVWNKTESEWECFDTGDQLPYCSVSDMEINHCTMNLRISTFGFGLWETPLPLGTHYSRPGGQAIEIDYDATWDYSRDAGRDIIIKPNASLTIENCELRMPKDHRIIVERGAVLKLDNAVITNYCEPWDGIEVWGNTSKAHPVSAAPVLNGTYPAALDDHGVVMVLNGSRIENAKTAIATYKSTPEGPAFGYNGAIVIAEESDFVNNQISVQFMPYDYPEIIGGADVENTDDDNISYFDNCTFTTNDKYFQDGHQQYQIYMWDVDGVEIRGCDFLNEIAEPVLADLGAAIYSTDATYTVKEAACAVSPCDDSNSIRGYYRGIEAANTSSLPLLDIAVTKTIFEDNVRGVLLSNVAHSAITLNRMQIDNAATTETYGLYLEDCADYQVEENLFKGIGMPGSYPVSAGIYVANNSNAITEIYNNYFTEVEVGIRSQTVNAKLQIRCNDFVEPINNYNIAITSGGIPNQGTCGGAVTDPAGNEFSREHSPDGDIKTQSGVSTFKYRHHSDYDYKPDWVTTPTVTLVDCGINASSGEPCPSHLSGGGEESASMMMGQAEGMEAAIEDLETMLVGYGAEEALGTDTYLTGMEDLEWLSNQKQILVETATDLYIQEGKVDSAEMILLEQNVLWADLKLVDLYINQSELDAATATLKSLPKGEDGISDYITLYTLFIELKKSARDVTALSEKETAMLDALAGKQSPAGVAAENILQLINGVDIPEVFDAIDLSEELRIAASENTPSQVQFYPNPTAEELSIDLRACAAEETIFIQAANLNGTVIWQANTSSGTIYTCDVSAWPAGVYFFSVYAGNRLVGTEKVVVE